MQIDPRLLEAFRSVLDSGSITQAATSLGLTQPAVGAAFARERPNIKVELFVRNSDVVRGMFPSRSYDIGIAELPVDPSGLTITRYRIGCVAIMPKNDPLTAYDIITPELMSGRPFVSMS